MVVETFHPTPISSRNCDGAVAHPKYSRARVSVNVFCARVIATKQFRRSSYTSLLARYDGNTSRAIPIR